MGKSLGRRQIDFLWNNRKEIESKIEETGTKKSGLEKLVSTNAEAKELFWDIKKSQVVATAGQNFKTVQRLEVIFEAEKAELKAEIDNLRERAERAETEVSELMEENGNLKKTIESMQAELNAADTTNDEVNMDLEKRFKDLEANLRADLEKFMNGLNVPAVVKTAKPEKIRIGGWSISQNKRDGSFVGARTENKKTKSFYLGKDRSLLETKLRQKVADAGLSFD